MFRDSLEVRREDGRIFEVIARPVYPAGEVTSDAEVIIRFQPLITEVVGRNSINLAVLSSEDTSEQAMDAGIKYVKKYQR